MKLFTNFLPEWRLIGRPRDWLIDQVLEWDNSMNERDNDKSFTYERDLDERANGKFRQFTFLTISTHTYITWDYRRCIVKCCAMKYLFLYLFKCICVLLNAAIKTRLAHGSRPIHCTATHCNSIVYNTRQLNEEFIQT